MTEQLSNGNDEDKEISVLNQTTNEMCHDSIFNSQKLFLANQAFRPPEFSEATKLRLMVKIRDEYKTIYEKPKEAQKDKKIEKSDFMYIEEENHQQQKTDEQQKNKGGSDLSKLISELPKEQQEKLSKIPKQFLAFQSKPQGETFLQPQTSTDSSNQKQLAVVNSRRVGSLLSSKIKKLVKPTWHPPWKLMRVIAGHQGWVRCVDIDPTNQWFVTGSNDRTIKFWDLASGQLKISLPGHISTVKSVVVSHRHTYLYSCSEDKTIKCWDLEANKIIRNYHGHLSGVMCLALHPELDLLISGGRDSTLRIWDIRTKAQVHVLEGHKHVVSSVATQEYEPQIISGSHDQTVRLWDIGTGKAVEVLTNHKKSIRSLLFHHEEYTFCTGGSDNLKVWKCPEGRFLRNISGHSGIANTVALNTDNVLVSGGDNGVLKFWDWKSGYNFQTINIKPQPGSISSEAGVFAAKFDKSQMRLITCECDKTIKIWKEDETATEETHPIDPDFRMAFENQRF